VSVLGKEVIGVERECGEGDVDTSALLVSIGRTLNHSVWMVLSQNDCP